MNRSGLILARYAVVLFGAAVASACSSSDSAPAAPAADSGTLTDTTPADTRSVSDTTSTPDTSSVDVATDTATSAACAYSVSGGLTQPLTDAPYGCANDKLEQPSGAGDYTASFGGGFVTAGGENFSLSCTIEELLAAPGALPAETVAAMRGRYL